MAQRERNRYEDSKFGRDENKKDWYERDPMDERSGYRDERSDMKNQRNYRNEFGYSGQERREQRMGNQPIYDKPSELYGRGGDPDRFTRQTREQHVGRGPRSFQRSDERIEEEINEMLTRHPSIDASEIEVQVKSGEVTLAGSVPDRRMRHLSEDVAEQCLGVKEIINNIRVKKESSEQESSSKTSVNERMSSTHLTKRPSSSSSNSNQGH